MNGVSSIGVSIKIDSRTAMVHPTPTDLLHPSLVVESFSSRGVGLDGALWTEPTDLPEKTDLNGVGFGCLLPFLAIMEILCGHAEREDLVTG